MKRVGVFIGGLLAAAWTAGVAAQGKDELWEVSTKMEMGGMFGMEMPKVQVCMEAGEMDRPDKLAPANEDDDCRQTDVKRSGNKVTWKMACTGQQQMTGSGEMTFGKGTYQGKVRMKIVEDGQTDEMAMSYSGRRIGTCDAAAEERKQRRMVDDMDRRGREARADADRQIAQSCDGAVKELQSEFLSSPGGRQMCPGAEKRVCQEVAKHADAMRTPKGYRKVAEGGTPMKKGWEGRFKGCGVQAPKLEPICDRAVKGKEYDFVADYCPEQVKVLGAQHCGGRDYTAMMSSDVRAVCSKYVSMIDRPGRSEEAMPIGPQGSDSPMDAAKEGVNQLKKLLGF